jgi:hypothetical protein
MLCSLELMRAPEGDWFPKAVPESEVLRRLVRECEAVVWVKSARRVHLKAAMKFRRRLKGRD